MQRTYSRIGVRIALIIGVLVFLLFAFVFRSEATGITFATSSGTGQSGLEMQIDSRTVYNGVIQPKLSWALKNLKPFCDYFFKFLDVKPGDTGQNTISIHIKKNPAWVCLDFLNLKDSENGNNEPESKVDVNGVKGGELSSGLEFFGWMDDGDNKYEVGERALFGTSTQVATTTLRGTSYALADAQHGTAFPVNSTRYVGISWCAGDLKVNTATGAITCNGATLGNGVQTDSMNVDVSLRAVSSKDQKTFTCVKQKTNGNNGHGNDRDHNDDSNPGHSNDGDDDTDDDGVPGHSGDGNSHNDDDHSEWHETPKGNGWNNFVQSCKKVINTFRS